MVHVPSYRRNWETCLRWSSGPDVLIFVINKAQWGCIDQNRFITARDYNDMASAVSGLRIDMSLLAGE